MAIGDNPISGLPADSGNPQPSVPNRPSGQPDAAPAAPDVGQPADVAGAGATSALGGGPAQPAKPGVGSRVASFISNGQGSPGSVWRGILSGALTGMVAGAGQGHFGGGVATGGAAAQKQTQQNIQNQQVQSNLESEQKLRAAQIAETNHRIVDSAWTLSHNKVQAAQEQATLENNLAQEAIKSGGTDLGVVRNVDDLEQLHRDNPNLPQDAARGNILTVPHFTADKDGNLQYDGARAVYVKPEWGGQKIDHDIPYPMFVPGTKGEAGHYEERTLTKGTVTNQDAMKTVMEQSAQAAKYDNELMIGKAQKAAADAAKDAAMTAKTAQDKADLQASIDSQANDVRSKNLDPSQLNKRSKTNDAIRAKVDADELKATGHTFDWAKASSDYKDAQGKRPTLDYLTSLTGTDGKSGNLALLSNVSKDVPRTDYPAVNDKAAWLKLETGNTGIAQYHTLAAEVADQVAKIMQGGGSGATSDAKMKQALDMFNTGFSQDQLDGVISTLREALNNRKLGMISNNGYLTKWYGNGGNPIANGAPVQGGAKIEKPVLPTPDNSLGLTPPPK